MASRVAITPLSAALALIGWISDHGGHLPRDREMRACNGLMGRHHYMNKFGGETFASAVCAAQDLVARAPEPRMQHCLGSECSAVFVYVGWHFCVRCRASRGDSEDHGRCGLYGDSTQQAKSDSWGSVEPAFSRRDLHRLLGDIAWAIGIDDDDTDVLYEPETSIPHIKQRTLRKGFGNIGESVRRV